jgi:hypothetical protein
MMAQGLFACEETGQGQQSVDRLVSPWTVRAL